MLLKGEKMSNLDNFVIKLIDDRLNPILAAHKGACELVKIEHGVVHLKLTGGCDGCPMRKQSFLGGIKPFLMKELEGEIEDVVLVDGY